MHVLLFQTPYETPFTHELAVLTKRGFLNTLRNPLVVWLRMGLYVMLSIMIGTVWLQIGVDTTSDKIQDIAAALFFICAFMVFMSVAVQVGASPPPPPSTHTPLPPRNHRRLRHHPHAYLQMNLRIPRPKLMLSLDINVWCLCHTLPTHIGVLLRVKVSYMESKAVYMRERASGLYSSTAYALANTLVDLPFILLLAFVCSTICYW
jgi:hypothetical protein